MIQVTFQVSNISKQAPDVRLQLPNHEAYIAKVIKLQNVVIFRLSISLQNNNFTHFYAVEYFIIILVSSQVPVIMQPTCGVGGGRGKEGKGGENQKVIQN